RDTKQHEVVVRVEADRRSVELVAAVDLHGRVVLARDHVRIRNDEALARDPARPLDGEPAGGAEYPDDALLGIPDVRVSQDASRRRGDIGLRAADLGERVGSRERVENRPGGGRVSFSLLRISERWMSLRNFRAPGVCSATAPTI